MSIFDDTKSWNQKLALYPHTIDFSQAAPLPKKSEVEYIALSESEPLKLECEYFFSMRHLTYL